MSDDSGQAPKTREVSDLIGVKLTLALAVWFLVVLVAFFFIGPAVGIIAVGVGVVGFGWALVNAVRNADVSE